MSRHAHKGTTMLILGTLSIYHDTVLAVTVIRMELNVLYEDNFKEYFNHYTNITYFYMLAQWLFKNTWRIKDCYLFVNTFIGVPNLSRSAHKGSPMLILGAVCYILSLIYCITFFKYKTRSTQKIFQDLCFQKNYYVRIGINRVANERYKIHLWGN